MLTKVSGRAAPSGLSSRKDSRALTARCLGSESGRCERFCTMWMPLSVSRLTWTGKASVVSSLVSTQRAQRSSPDQHTF